MTKCSHDIIRVEWIDADEKAGWEVYEKKPARVIYTIGYLIEKPKTKGEFLVLANSHLPDEDEWSGLSRIPKGMILGMETLITAAPCGHTLMDDNTPNNSRRSRALPVRQPEI